MPTFDWHMVSVLQAMAAGGIALALGFFMNRYRKLPEARMQTYLLWATAVFAFAYALEYQTASLSAKLFWRNLKFTGVIFVPPFFLAFAWGIGGRRHLITRRNLLLLCIIPAISVLLAWTNSYHGLMISRAWLVPRGDFLVLAYERGPWFWVTMAYVYLLMTWSLVSMCHGFWKSGRLRLGHVAFLALAPALPLSFTTIYIFRPVYFHYIDLGPISLTASALIVSWGMYRMHLLNLVPLARQAVMEGIADPVLVLDLEFRLVDFNSSARRLLGLPAQDWQGRPLWEFLALDPPGLRRLEPDQGYQAEVELKLAGESRVFELHLSPLRSRRGRPAGRLMVMRDITERKQAEEALRRSEERHRLLLERLPEAVAVYDMEGRVMYVNPAFESTFGWSREELLGRRIDFVPPEEMGCTSEALVHMLQGRPVRNLETKRLCKDGRVLDVNLNTAPFYDSAGRQVGNIVLLRDVTDLKIARKGLRQSEERNRAILEAAADPTVVYDTEGRVTYFNPAFTRVFGWRLEERLGRRLDDFVPEDCWPETRRMIERVLKGKSFSGIESVRYTKSGRRIPVSMSGAIFRDQEGRPAGSVINLRDISETKKLEAQLLQSQKLEALGTLAGGVAHEFNNILMTIRGYSQILRDLPGLDRKAVQYLQKIEAASDKAADLTGTMLDFARQESGERVPVDLNQVVREVATLLEGSLPPSIDLELEPAPGLPRVMGNPNQLEQVVLNLAVNARDAMPNGGRLLLRTRLRRLEAEFCQTQPWARPGPYLELEVADTGQGIPPQVMKRIFEPFYTTKEPGQGTGLGLSVAYSVVKNHGGGILARSEPGQGSRFRLYLPVEQEPIPTSPDRNAPPPAPAGRGQRVLVVDDEEPVRDIVAQALEAQGYQVERAAQGSQALEMYQEARQEGRPFQVIILDLAMPVMDGRQFLERLAPIDPGARVLVTTGHAGRLEGLERYRPLLRAVLRKPFDLNRLAREVARALNEDEGDV